MKVRYGFVSNSSSSSFLVPIEELTEFQEKQLQGYGFVQVETDNPFRLHFIGRKVLECDGGCSLAYEVTCNQEEFACLLAKELEVSFSAAVHYGHWLWTYKRSDDKIHCYHNLGMEVYMYRNIGTDQSEHKTPRYYTININELEREEYVL